MPNRSIKLNMKTIMKINIKGKGTIMKKVWIIIAVFVVSATLAISMGGCAQQIASKLVEKAVEGAAAKSGDSVDINLDNGEVKMTDESGNEVSLGGTTVPEGWPSSVPVNDKIKISFSGSSKTDGKSNWNVSGTYTGTGQELYDWYKSKLSGMTTDSDSVFEADGEKTYSLQSSDTKYVVTLWVTENKTEVAVILNISEK
jgi:hypothetical protein